MKKRFKPIKKLILLAVSLAVVLGVIEGGARVFLGSEYPMNKTDSETVRLRILFSRFFSHMFRRSSDEKICFELIPGGRITLLDQSYTINSHGLRSPEIEMDKPPGTIRIALLGDSFVFGWGADDVETIPAMMERILSRGGGSDVRYEVINSGVPGFNVAQMKELLRSKVFSLDPDLLVLVVSANDIVSHYLHYNTLFNGLYADFLPLPYSWKPFFWRAFVSYRFLVQSHKEHLEESGEVGSFNQRDLEFFDREIRLIRSEAEKMGLGFLLVILPILEDFNSYPYEKQHQDMHAVLEGMDFVDLYSVMKQWEVEDLWFRPEDHHLNRRANLAVARLILSSLQKREQIELQDQTLPEDPLAQALFQPGDLVIADMDADPAGRGGFPGAIFAVSPEGGEVRLVSADPAFREPVDLVFDPMGNLLVLDAEADPLGLGSHGAVFVVDRFTGQARVHVTSEWFCLPNSLLLAGDGRIFISEKEYDPEGLGTDTGALLVYDPKRDRLEVLASGPEFVAPGAIAFAPEEKLYFIDADSNPRGYPGTPGVLFEVDQRSGAYRSLIEFKETVSPVGIVPLPDGRLIVIDANADRLKAGYFFGGVLMVDPVQGEYEFILDSVKLMDPTRGDLGLDGFLYFTDSNADPLKLGPDGADKGVQGTGPGAILRFDYEKGELSLIVSHEKFVNPVSLKVVPEGICP